MSLLERRVAAVRDLCERNVERPPGHPDALTNRGWLAQSVLNVLTGLIDDQLTDPEGWALIADARREHSIQPAVVHVEQTLARNRGYLGALGDNELAAMIIHNLVGDGWVLTPPPKEDHDAGTVNGRAGRTDRAGAAGEG
jgi:hypothetical protein